LVVWIRAGINPTAGSGGKVTCVTSTGESGCVTGAISGVYRTSISGTISGIYSGSITGICPTSGIATSMWISTCFNIYSIWYTVYIFKNLVRRLSKVFDFAGINVEENIYTVRQILLCTSRR